MMEQKGFEPFGDPRKSKDSGRWLCPDVAGLVRFAPRWGKVAQAASLSENAAFRRPFLVTSGW